VWFVVLDVRCNPMKVVDDDHTPFVVRIEGLAASTDSA
jgi:hypothetical protein